MSFSESSRKKRNVTQKNSHISQKQNNHIMERAGHPIAEMEIAPHGQSLMSLGEFKEREQPRGFCIEYNAEIERPELVKSEVTAREIAGGLQYLLQIANKTSNKICAEIRVF